MSPNLRIAFRFLTAKKRAMTMSLSCIVLGVGLFVVTQATTSGFEDLFIKTILGTNGAMRIEDEIQDTLAEMKISENSDFTLSQREEGRKYIEGVQEPKLIMDALKDFSNVAAASAVLRGNVLIRSSFKNESAQVFGINIDDHLKVSDLRSQVVFGSLEEFRSTPSGVLIGKELADRLRLQVGSSILLDASNNQLRRYRICAIYETGVSDIDKVRVYIQLNEARSLLKKTTGVSFIQLNLFDKYRAPQDASRLEDVLKHSAKPWQVREKTWLEVFRALRISTGITVSVFTLIAGLAMYNTLALIVMEKTKDIAILRSMGYGRADISQIFIWQAGIVLAIGTVGGAIFGATATYAVSTMPLAITGIFKTETFIVAWSGWHYVQAVLTAVVMVMIASLLPARRAARLEPGDIIRGTAQ
jgi:lipoprotein-releasing system permease protein